MDIPTLEGITPNTITSDRLTTRVLFSGPEGGQPVLFLHGNASSATWWEEAMTTLPAGFRGIAPDQRGYGSADPQKKIDATRGMGDLAEDAMALLNSLDIDRAHVVGSSLGGVVVWRLMMDYADRLLTVTQVAPGSPYGFGGTKDVAGTPCYEDYAGSGAGLINPEFVQRIASGDRSLEAPVSPRAALRSLVFKPGFIPEREDAIVEALLSMHLGEQAYPGDAVPSPNWPFTAPGVWGPNNALSPKYLTDVERLYQTTHKPPVLWIRGADDLTVSDTAAADPGALGAAGVIPGWPGMDVYPPQPMLAQTRAVLERYGASGGSYQEVVLEDCAHAPYIEKVAAFNEAFHAHVDG